MPQLLLVAGAMALMMALVVYQAHKVRCLREHGTLIAAMVTSVRHETGKTGWGFTRDNYYVTATWTNPRMGRTYTFWTWAMNSYPTCSKGNLVPVVIDPKNPKHYALEI